MKHPMTSSNLRIGTRIGMSFAATIILLLCVALLAGQALGSVNQAVRDVTKDFYVKVQLINDIQIEINEQSRRVRNTLILDKPEQVQGELKL
jgi:methyl-accepting chemotaxis protein